MIHELNIHYPLYSPEGFNTSNIESAYAYYTASMFITRHIQFAFAGWLPLRSERLNEFTYITYRDVSLI